MQIQLRHQEESSWEGVGKPGRGFGGLQHPSGCRPKSLMGAREEDRKTLGVEVNPLLGEGQEARRQVRPMSELAAMAGDSMGASEICLGPPTRERWRGEAVIDPPLWEPGEGGEQAHGQVQRAWGGTGEISARPRGLGSVIPMGKGAPGLAGRAELGTSLAHQGLVPRAREGGATRGQEVHPVGMQQPGVVRHPLGCPMKIGPISKDSFGTTWLGAWMDGNASCLQAALGIHIPVTPVGQLDDQK